MNALGWVKNHQMVGALCVTPVLLCSAYSYAEDAAAPAVEAAPSAEAAPAAEAEAPASPWSANLTIANQYVTRGFSNSLGDPVIQGGVDYTSPTGFNVGYWMSTLNSRFVQGSWAEMDFYAGYTKSFGDLNVGAQIYYYIYPDGKFIYDKTLPNVNVSYNYGEFVPTLSYKWFSAKYWYTYTKNYFGINNDSMFTTGRGSSRGSGYLDLNVNYDLGDGYGFIGHYGHQEVKSFEFANWHDAKIGVTKTLGGPFSAWTATLAVSKVWTDYAGWKSYDIDASKISDPIKGTVIFSLGRTFSF